MRFPAPEEQSATGEPASASSSQWRGKGTALVVDDEDTVRQLVAAQARYLGFKVIEARDGREALAWYRRHRHELAVVLMDQTMPEMEGTEAAREMQRLGGDAPIVMLSGYAEENVVSEKPTIGVAGFIQKPFSLEDLRRTLEGLLR